jgi:hypothetical protein
MPVCIIPMVIRRDTMPRVSTRAKHQTLQHGDTMPRVSTRAKHQSFQHGDTMPRVSTLRDQLGF